MKILHVNANPKPIDESVSKQLSEFFFKKLKEHNSNVRIDYVDLYKDWPPFYSYNTYRNFWYPVFVPGYTPSNEEKESALYALEHAELFNKADILAITSPMWNFSVPAILKAWIDMVLSPGLTFNMGPGGVTPLHKISKVIVFSSSGGAYEENDQRECLYREIKAAFGFVKVTDYEIVWAQGQNMFFFKDWQDRKNTALKQAEKLAESVSKIKIGV